MKLYSYFRSSASFRVRIALGLKGLDHEIIPVHLVRGGGEQHSSDYRAVNPAGLVPALDDDGQIVTQSLAIIEYLEETHPNPPLLPSDAAGRARVRALAQSVACEIHPLNNLRVLNYLTKTLGVSDDEKNAWYRHWVEDGVDAIERMLGGAGHRHTYCHGETPGLADVVLVPQIFNAKRFNCRLDHVPTVMRIHDACMRLEPFIMATPARQPDAE